ncbi:MAG: hypothetical protein ACLPI9_03950 [Halobacteriota archaeon]
MTKTPLKKRHFCIYVLRVPIVTPGGVRLPGIRVQPGADRWSRPRTANGRPGVRPSSIEDLPKDAVTATRNDVDRTITCDVAAGDEVRDPPRDVRTVQVVPVQYLY